MKCVKSRLLPGRTGLFALGALLAAGMANVAEGAVRSADVVVWKDGDGTFHAENRNEIIHSGPSILDAIQQAMNSLTPGRTVKEKVKVVSSGTVTRTVDSGEGPAEGLMIPSYTILDIPATIGVEIDGSASEGESYDKPVLVKATDAEHIEIPNINIKGDIDRGIKLESVSNIRIGRAHLDVTGGAPVRIDSDGSSGRSRDIRIDSVYIEGGDEHAFEARGVDRLQVRRIIANHMSGCGVFLDGTNDVTINSIVGYNPASATRDATFRVANGDKGRITVGELVSIDAPRGIHIHDGAGEVVVAGIYIDGARNRGIVVDGSANIILSGGVIKNVVGTAIDVFAWDDDSASVGRADGVSISDFRIYDDRPAGERTQTHGILFLGGNGLIVNNDVRDAGTEANIFVGSPAALVRDNIGGGIAQGTVTLETGSDPAARIEGVSDYRSVPLELRARTYDAPEASFSWDHYFEYNGRSGRWDLIIEWRGDPGENVELEYIIDRPQTGTGRNGEDLIFPLPEAPAGLRATSGADRVLLEWERATGVIHEILVKRSASPDGPYETIASLEPTASSHVDASVAEGETRYYVVVARAAGAESQSEAVGIVVHPSLWMWIPFDEGVGSVAEDATGRGRDAALTGGATWGEGRNGSALALDGQDGSHAELPAGILEDLSGITFAAWVFWEGGGDWQRVFDFGHDRERYLFLTPRSGAGTLRFAITTSGSSGQQIVESRTALQTGVWNHVAVTLSGNTGRLYLNGERVGRNASMTLRPFDLGPTPNNWIGRSQWPDPYLNGRIEDFRIYAGPLSQTEIAALIQHGVTTPGPPAGVQAALQSEGEAVELIWQEAVEADEYTVWRSVGDEAYEAIAAGLTETFFLDDDVLSGEWHTYRVTAGNAAGESPPSAEISVEIPALLQSDDTRVRSVKFDGENIVLTMPAVSGFRYQLQQTRDIDSGEWEDVGEPVPASGEEVELSDIHDPAGKRTFYRVIIRPDS